tara:strand:+ start:603 stop:884 length:282 start_codon:yes stop_codon:yes gene_type:complete
MYNEGVKQSIYKYRQKIRDNEDFKANCRKYSKGVYERMKNSEDKERYTNKLNTSKIAYYKKLYSNDVEKYNKSINRLSNKNNELYNLVISVIG